MEGQTITLEDGSTAVVQAITGQSESHGRLAPSPHYTCLRLVLSDTFKVYQYIIISRINDSPILD